MKKENINSLKVVQAIQKMDEIDIFRIIAKKHTISELSNLFLVSKTAMYELCKKYEIEHLAGECEEQAIARKRKPVERVEAMVLFTCDMCKAKKPVELESPKMGTCTKCLMNLHRSRV
jgi:hypothetical protein